MGYLLSLQPTFTQGLILGQLSILVLLALVLKYLFFVSDPSATHHLPTTIPVPRSSAAQDAPSDESKIESTEWLNSLLAQILQTYRSELRENQSGTKGDEFARRKVEKKDPMLVHSVDLGHAAPRISAARKSVSPASGETQIEFDMTYSDSASISFSTSVLFNYPFPYFARLPVSLSVSLAVFASKIILTLPQPASSMPTLTFALAPTFNLELNISSLLGSRAKLADVPKLHDMIESQVKKVLAARGSWTVVLPSITRPQGVIDTRYPSEEIDVKLVNEGIRRPLDLRL
ncbi:maintenance of mitochondrial morphology protein 1 [Hysterangium stoloniferum]|nr:maintenance of mitochondrial morphology protein 1 [Hysterangium stoloniferum]